ncbi:MAG: helix-turn-helix transcriptional regulator [Polyangiaceae bacterium]|nr:helix-turn-helix transcriptional regulator [Polyangiaceae bacterium]
MSKSDLVGVIESAYALERSEQEWLDEIARAARVHLDAGFGVAAFTVDARGKYELLTRAFVGDDPRVYDSMIRGSDIMARQPRDFRAESFRAGPCQTISQVVGAGELRKNPEIAAVLDSVDAGDMMGVVGADPTGFGVGLGGLLPQARAATRAEVRRWSRVVAHLAAGYRLRRTLAERPVVAVLSPSGELEHAEGGAKPTEAREALRRAAQAVDRARGRLRREDADEALETWRGLVSGRWSLVDQFESDGRRFVVARQNDPETPFPPNLTQRERQVLIYRMLGHPLKLIGYELGLGTSTVSSALSSALGKLGVESVTDVIRFLMPGGGGEG